MRKRNLQNLPNPFFCPLLEQKKAVLHIFEVLPYCIYGAYLNYQLSIS